MRRVVITGIGAYSCLGKNIDEVRESLYVGRSGIGVDPFRDELGFRSNLTGIIERPVLKGLLPRRERVGLAEEGEYAFLSTKEALEMAGIDMDFLEANEVGVLFGNDSSAAAVMDAIDKVREKRDTTLLKSGSIFQSMNSTVTMSLSTIFKLRGINFTISGACASGSHSIGLAYLMIRYGLQKHIICGGAQEVNAWAMGSFDGIRAFSTRLDAPTQASRPFDRDRDGLVPSGGAATVILEDYEAAKARGANILGEVVGYGFSSNGGHISQPSVEGPERALTMALKDANMTPAEVDYVNAHATSTPVGDRSEAQALATFFAEPKTPISSTKSMTGHECWMAGASEIVYSLLMMRDSFVAPNINFENPDEAAVNLNIKNKTVEHKIDCFLSNSFGFGGTNSSLIIKKMNP